GTAETFGTPLYMSPEQLKNTKDADHRTDVWALGVIVHQLVAARMPFEGPTAPNIIARILAEPPTPLRTHRADAPPGLEAVVRRCLEKDRGHRFQSVAELARALAPYAPQAAASVDRIARILDPVDAGATTEPAPTRKAPAKAATEPVAGGSTDGGL